jgi:acyl carrier protein
VATEPAVVARVRLLVSDVLAVEVPSDDTDLIGSGLIDSLALITMITEIEHEFGLELALDDLDVAQFRSVRTIADYLSRAALAIG